MENILSMAGLGQSLAILLHQFPLLQLMIDLAIKSIVLLTVFVIMDTALGKRITSTSRHLLWLNSLFCLLLLLLIPVTLLIFDNPATGQVAPDVLFELSVYPASLQSADMGIPGWGLLLLYLIPALVLLARLLVALRSIRRLSRQSRLPEGGMPEARLAVLRKQLRITRRVSLRISDDIESPVSFGLFAPAILLPAQARDWNDSIITDVLLHELCHIKRLDWLTTLLAYVLASLFWINPLVWLAIARLREESENSCDSAVLCAGRSDTDYAQSLLGVAVSCVHARRGQSNSPGNPLNPSNPNNRTNPDNRNSNPLLQTMLDQNTLKTRISRVLEEKKMQVSEMKRQTKRAVAVLLLMSAGLLSVLSTHQVLLAQEQPDPATRTIDEEMFPLNSIVPRYPTVAANEGIEGWVQVSFTVSADGSVAGSSVSIVDSQPAEVFNNSALAAAKQFLFSPRIVAGQPVDVPNVQYVFRYKLRNDS
tara:strand:- start:92321 stop:93757 length:1437 start_codon:yes stop_codon:yes gene_type:complete